jgi:hypothetical protein
MFHSSTPPRLRRVLDAVGSFSAIRPRSQIKISGIFLFFPEDDPRAHSALWFDIEFNRPIPEHYHRRQRLAPFHLHVAVVLNELHRSSRFPVCRFHGNLFGSALSAPPAPSNSNPAEITRKIYVLYFMESILLARRFDVTVRTNRSF